MNGQTCTNDILGNRLTKGSNTYGWDAFNRMTSYNATAYQYRADGMRTKKTSSSASTTYRYDGQMAVQDVEVDGGVTTTNTYALGARGVDMVTKTSGSTTTVGYPIYDGHGNRVATLTKSGLSFSLTDLRNYGAWGNVLTGDPAGRPRARYVASIGHVQDDESGLVYMRARYYEPGSGRFVSEDPGMQGLNWFTYCANDPINFSDPTGLYHVTDYGKWSWGNVVGYTFGMAAVALAWTDTVSFKTSTAKLNAISGLLVLSAIGFTAALLGGTDFGQDFQTAMKALGSCAAILRVISTIAGGLASTSLTQASSLAKTALAATTVYSMAICGALLALECD